MVLESYIEGLRKKFTSVVIDAQSVNEYLLTDIQNEESLIEHMGRSLHIIKISVRNLKTFRDKSIIHRERSRSNSIIVSQDHSLVGSSNGARSFISKINERSAKANIALPYSSASQHPLKINNPKLESLQNKMSELRSKVEGKEMKDRINRGSDPTTIVIQNNINKVNYCMQPQQKLSSEKLIRRKLNDKKTKLSYNISSEPNSRFLQVEDYQNDLVSGRQYQPSTISHSKAGGDSPNDPFSPGCFGDHLADKKGTKEGTRPQKVSREKLLERIKSIRSDTHFRDNKGSEVSKLSFQDHSFVGLNNKQYQTADESHNKGKVKNLHSLLSNISDSVNRVMTSKSRIETPNSKVSVYSSASKINPTLTSKYSKVSDSRSSILKVPALNLQSGLKTNK